MLLFLKLPKWQSRNSVLPNNDILSNTCSYQGLLYQLPPWRQVREWDPECQNWAPYIQLRSLYYDLTYLLLKNKQTFCYVDNMIRRIGMYSMSTYSMNSIGSINHSFKWIIQDFYPSLKQPNHWAICMAIQIYII